MRIFLIFSYIGMASAIMFLAQLFHLAEVEFGNDQTGNIWLCNIIGIFCIGAALSQLFNLGGNFDA